MLLKFADGFEPTNCVSSTSFMALVKWVKRLIVVKSVGSREVCDGELPPLTSGVPCIPEGNNLAQL
jgi:hypothetical protein